MKKFVKEKMVHISLMIVGVFFCVAVYTYHTASSSAETARNVGTLTLTLSPIGGSHINTEYIEVSYTGFGKFDLGGLQLENSKGNIYTFKSIQIPPDGVVRICANASRSYTCNLEWHGGEVWDDEGDTLTLVNKSGDVLIEKAYIDLDSDAQVQASLPVTRPVLGINDRVYLCHSSTGKTYSRVKSSVYGIVRDPEGHVSHIEFDIIPPFLYIIDNRIEYFEGLNWFGGEEVYEGECM